MRFVRLFGLGVALVLVASSVGTAQPKVITVCSSGCDFTLIQAAIASTTDGSTIQTKAGTYTEGLTITKSLSLVGEGPDTTIIQGGIAILATKAVNVTGFTVEGQGIRVQDSQAVSLLNNVIDQSTSDGLLIANSATVAVQGSTLVRGSTIQNSKGSGIVIVLGSKAIVSANTIRSNGSDGISVGASQADLRDNAILNNGGCGINADSASQLSGSGNTGQVNARGDACGSVPSGLITPTLAPMVLIPAGSFQMGDSFNEGSPDERPVHTVTVSAFYMDVNDVTVGLWNAVVIWAKYHDYDLSPRGGPDNPGDNYPVVDVSWYETMKWANARSEREGLTPCYYTDSTQRTVYRTGSVDVAIEGVKWSGCGYRLPTEAEWEKAARVGLSGQRYPWGNDIDCTKANYFPCVDHTTPVGSYEANGYGLHDMAGNVWEPVWDWYDSSYYANSPGSDPRGPASGSYRVLRGGGWERFAISCRVASRVLKGPPASIGDSVGIRVVRPAGQ